MTDSKDYEFDVFISHASEDKDTFVRQFAGRLVDLGLTVWYDEFTLNVGDSLSASIDKGIVRSRYGIVVLSDHFLSKNWTDYELRSLLSLQVGGRQRILPIWHQLSKDALLRYSPYLADRIALSSQDGIDRNALRVIRVVRPEIYDTMKFWARFWQQVSDGQPQLKPIDELKLGKQLRPRLTDGQMRRIRISGILLEGAAAPSFEQSYDAFLRDLPVEDEIQKWEWLALVYHLYKTRHHCTQDETRRLFYLLVRADFKKMITMYADKEKIDELAIASGLDIDSLLDIIRETNQHPTLNEDKDS